MMNDSGSEIATLLLYTVSKLPRIKIFGSLTAGINQLEAHTFNLVRVCFNDAI